MELDRADSSFLLVQLSAFTLLQTIQLAVEVLTFLGIQVLVTSHTLILIVKHTIYFSGGLDINVFVDEEFFILYGSKLNYYSALHLMRRRIM